LLYNIYPDIILSVNTLRAGVQYIRTTISA